MSSEPTNAEVLAEVRALRSDLADLAPLLQRAAVDADMRQALRRQAALRKISPTAEIERLISKREARRGKAALGADGRQPHSPEAA